MMNQELQQMGTWKVRKWFILKGGGVILLIKPASRGWWRYSCGALIHDYTLGFNAADEDNGMFISLQQWMNTKDDLELFFKYADLTISWVWRTLVRCTLVPGVASSLAGESVMAGGSLDFASFRLTSDKAEQTFRYAWAGSGRLSSKKSGTGMWWENITQVARSWV